MILVSSCGCLRPIHWSQVLSREWRCSWSSSDRRCSNYNLVINLMLLLILEVWRYVLVTELDFLRRNDAIWYPWFLSSLVQVMACCIISTKPLPDDWSSTRTSVRNTSDYVDCLCVFWATLLQVIGAVWVSTCRWLNLLAPWRFEWHFRCNFQNNFSDDDVSYVLWNWMSLDLTDNESTLVQVIAWCCQATSVTWASVDPDLCCHVASLGHNELTQACSETIHVIYMIWFFWK